MKKSEYAIAFDALGDDIELLQEQNQLMCDHFLHIGARFVNTCASVIEKAKKAVNFVRSFLVNTKVKLSGEKVIEMEVELFDDDPYQLHMAILQCQHELEIEYWMQDVYDILKYRRPA